jgi:mannitol-1-phosphate/altronate dehydrogenase
VNRRLKYCYGVGASGKDIHAIWELMQEYSHQTTKIMQQEATRIRQSISELLSNLIIRLPNDNGSDTLKDLCVSPSKKLES